MRKKYFSIPKIAFGVLVLFLLISACGTKKKMVEQTEKIDKNSLLLAYEVNQLDFEQLAFEANMGYSGGSMNMDFNGSFRIKHNEKIWASFKKFGFEVARVLVTPDSIFVVNRFQRQFIAEDIAKLKDLSGVPLEFQDLEQILIGGSFWTEGLQAVNDSTLAKVATIKNEIVDVKHILNKQNFTKFSKITSKNQGNMSIDYADFSKFNNAFLAQDRTIHALRDGSNVILTLKTTNFEAESSKTFPFEIPKDYSRQSF